jgi:hypothetical protein
MTELLTPGLLLYVLSGVALTFFFAWVGMILWSLLVRVMGG